MRNPKLAGRFRSKPTNVRRGEVKRGHAVMPRVTVADIFYAGERHDLMCRLDVHGAIDEPVVIVAPITQLALDPRPPFAHDIPAYRKRRAETTVVTGHAGT